MIIPQRRFLIAPFTRRPAIVALLLLAIVSQAACDKNKVREARKAGYRIQVVLGAAIDTTATLHNARILDDAKTNKIAHLLLKINQGNKVLIEKAGAATVDTPELRRGILADLKIIKDGIRELKDIGVLGIKSENGSLAFESAMTALDAAVAIIEVAMEGRQ